MCRPGWTAGRTSPSSVPRRSARAARSSTITTSPQKRAGPGAAAGTSTSSRIAGPSRRKPWRKARVPDPAQRHPRGGQRRRGPVEVGRGHHHVVDPTAPLGCLGDAGHSPSATAVAARRYRRRRPVAQRPAHDSLAVGSELQLDPAQPHPLAVTVNPSAHQHASGSASRRPASSIREVAITSGRSRCRSGRCAGGSCSSSATPARTEP